MLRVGLTGDLGSGKSTVAAMFTALGARVFSSDEMARAMMQPRQPVYQAIVDLFGASVLNPDATLDRRELARLAFSEGRVEQLNAIIHPAVIAEQARLLQALSQSDPHAIAIIESALIFTAKTGESGRDAEPWRKRFDRIVLVRAPLETKLARFVARSGAGTRLTAAEQSAAQADARSRLALQADANESHLSECLVIENDDGLSTLQKRVESVWRALEREASSADIPR